MANRTFLTALLFSAILPFLLRAEQNGAMLPFVLNVSPQGDGVVLQGSIPTREQKLAIYEAAVTVLGTENVENRLKLSPKTIAEPWIDSLPGLITSFLEFSRGEADFTIVDGKIILQGEIGERKKYESLRGKVYGGVPGQLLFEDRLTVNGERMTVPDESNMLAVDEEVEEVEETSEVVAVADSPPSNDPVAGKKMEVAPVVTVEAASAAKPEFEKETASSAAVVGGESNTAREPSREEEEIGLADYGPDPGGPLLFYFDTGSSEIRPEDRHRIAWAIERCQRERTILYVTGYADYRGSYTLNRKLTMQRTESVRDAIFRGDVANDLKAELKAGGDAQSGSRDAWRNRDSEAALQYSRRVVVETYQLR